MTGINRRRFVASITATAACATLARSAAALSNSSQMPADANGLSLMLANADRIQDIRSGWVPIILVTLEKMWAIDPDLKIRQIKQKLGGLRLYYDSQHHDELAPLVSEAEFLCGETCEECGRGGSIFKSDGWIRTLCKEHGPF
jgi:hypothetical protein